MLSTGLSYVDPTVFWLNPDKITRLYYAMDRGWWRHPQSAGKEHRRPEWGRGTPCKRHESTRLHFLLSVQAQPRRWERDWNWKCGWGLRVTKASDASLRVWIPHEEDRTPVIRFWFGKISVENGLLEERIWDRETTGSFRGTVVHSRNQKDLLFLIYLTNN